MHHVCMQYQTLLLKEISSQSCKPLGHYEVACARARASLMLFLMQGTAREFLRNKSETCPCPSGCQRPFQVMSDLSQTLCPRDTWLSLCLRTVSARTLSPGDRLKCLDTVHLGRDGSWKTLAALRKAFPPASISRMQLPTSCICSTPGFDEPQKEQLLPP